MVYIIKSFEIIRFFFIFASNLLFAKFLLGFNVIIHCTACCIAYLILHQLWTCFTQSIYSSHFCKWCFHIKSDRDFQNGKVRQEFHIFKLLYNLYLLIVQTWFYCWYYLHTAHLFFDTFMFSLVLFFDYVPLVFIILKLYVIWNVVFCYVLLTASCYFKLIYLSFLYFFFACLCLGVWPLLKFICVCLCMC